MLHGALFVSLYNEGVSLPYEGNGAFAGKIFRYLRWRYFLHYTAQKRRFLPPQLVWAEIREMPAQRLKSRYIRLKYILI
jgi:hypothetical protein